MAPFLPMPNSPVDPATLSLQPQAPLELHHPRPQSNSMKRRAECALSEELLSEDPEIRREWLNTMFDGQNDEERRRGVRRGFSLGAGGADVSFHARHVSNVFGAPAMQQAMPAMAYQQQQQPLSPLPPAQAHVPAPRRLRPARYLRSPFEAAHHDAALSNTFPRTLFTQSVDAAEPSGDTTEEESGDPFVSGAVRGTRRGGRGQ